ncbi:MAG: hypothetical protein H0V80_01880, partial [Acidobacteria bacterium]|nr:hypothetical protein [Acidobacteriota bacterium]
PGLGAFAGLALAPAGPGPVRRFEVVARRADPESSPGAPPAPPDPRLVAAETLVQHLEQRQAETNDRLTEVRRGHDAVTSALETAEATVAAASRELEQATRAADRAQAALDAVTAEVARLAEERAEADRVLSALRAAARTDRPARRRRRTPE